MPAVRGLTNTHVEEKEYRIINLTCNDEQRPTENWSSRNGLRVLTNTRVDAGLLGTSNGTLSSGPILAWILDLVHTKIDLNLLYQK
jgi:hypothetical protein